MARSFTKIVAFAFVLAFTFGIARTSRAQDADKDVIKPLTAQGSAAFMFTISGLGSFGIGSPGLGSDTAGPILFGVGGKWYLADDLALRVLLALHTHSGNPNYPDSSSVKPSSTQFGIGVGVEKHFRPLYSTSPYVGAQISFADQSTDNGASGNAEFKTSSSTFGVAALAGFDWFFTKGIAAGAEMALGFSTTSNSTTGPSESGSSVTANKQSVTNIALATGGDVHLVVYF
ncbi:MAG: outer membrane beta-barrel protein [Candidatus Kapaibacterium sp.]